ncbi:unnamed protein product, partial [Laminaria digitata]
KDLCETVLRAALSGLLVTPSPPPPPPAAAATHHTRLASSALPSSSSLSSSPLSTGRDQHEWDEAFLGFLWAAVSRFPAVRRSLLTVTGTGNVPATVSGTVTGNFTVTDANGEAADSAKAGATAAVAEAPVAAVLRRLYHPRPSVRRLASLIAVRLAFDAAAFFSPLLLPGCRRVSHEEAVEGGVATGVRYCARCGSGCGEKILDGDGFVVPTMVVQGYPRLKEWAGGGGGGSGGGCSGCTSCSGCSGGYSGCSGCNICSSSSCDGGDSGGNTETPLFIKLSAGEWAMLTRKRAAMGVPRDAERHEGGRGVGVAERGVVVARLERALRVAGRRSEFAVAMLKARAWMLAGHG